jgi:cysteine-rich repeat protein
MRLVVSRWHPTPGRPGGARSRRFAPWRPASRLPIAPALLLLVGLLLGAPEAQAKCNAIPAATKDFRAALGSANRPFASPGDYVEVRAQPTRCGGDPSGFVDLDLDGDVTDDYVVTVLFTPKPLTGGPPRNAVVLAESCTGIDLAACESQLGAGGDAQCLPVNAPGDPVGLEVEGPDALQLRFPDTDDVLDDPQTTSDDNDDRTFSGPAKIVVSRRSAVVASGPPCALALAGSRCANTTINGVVACVDELYEGDGTCGTNQAQRHATFAHFTALPPPNDYQALCTTPPNCTGLATELRFTTDSDGHALIPLDSSGILLRDPEAPVPIPQLARVESPVDAFGSLPGSQAVDLPGDGVIASYSPEGVILPPVFSALSEPSHSKAILFGSIDAERGVIRVARFGCEGGADAGKECSVDAQCSSGECRELFDFEDRYEDGVGPVLLAEAQNLYTATLENPVPIEGLIAGEETFAFVLAEAIDGADSNGPDGDETDWVATLRDRDTGLEQPIGPGGALGRAVVRVRQPPFAFPAVETQGDLLAFLESEPAQGVQESPLTQDTNDNETVFDSILRVFRLGTGEVASPETADAAPVIDGRSVVVSAGNVFFRTAEAVEADRVTTIVSVAASGVPGNEHSTVSSFSADGRYVVFESRAKDLEGPLEQKETSDIFVHDRDADEDGIFDLENGILDPGEIRTVRMSVDSMGNRTDKDDRSQNPSMSPDGRFVAFESDSGLLVSGDGNSKWDIFVHDRDADEDGIFDDEGDGYQAGEVETVRVSVSSAGAPATNNSFNASVSADGRAVAFDSDASNLAPDTNGVNLDVFVHDRDADGDGIFDEPGAISTVLVSVDSQRVQGNQQSTSPSISTDGRFVAFQSNNDLMPGGDANGANSDVFLHDRDADEDGVFDEDPTLEPGAIETVLASKSSLGFQADSSSDTASISWDGRVVAFKSQGKNLAPGDTNNKQDVFLHHAASTQTVRTSVHSSGSQGSNNSDEPWVSGDGRFVAFASTATDLAPDGLSAQDVFVHDAATGHTALMSVSSSGTQGTAASSSPSISPEGRFVAFSTLSPLTGDSNGKQDVFVRGPDTSQASLTAFDRTGDGRLDDTVLRVLDTSVGGPPTDLCPAEAVAVVASCTGGTNDGQACTASSECTGEGATCVSRAAFLRPEWAGATSNAACTGESLTGPDLNGDADAEDLVVQLYDGSAVHNLGCAATDIALSPTVVAALVPEADQGAGSLNGDGDSDDLVLHVRAPSGPASCGQWANTGLAGDAVSVSGDVVVVITPECDEGGDSETDGCPPPGGTDLNGDGDAADRVVRLVDGTTGNLIPIVGGTPQAAEETVAGPSLVALRTREGDLCNAGAGSVTLSNCASSPPGCSGIAQCNLNGDADCCDDVLQLYELATGELLNTGQAVFPCRIVACDPRRPYRVSLDTVRFLTFESQQSEDLNDDGDQSDLLVQVFNARSGESVALGRIVDTEASEEAPETGASTLAATGSEAGGEQVFISQDASRGHCATVPPVPPVPSCTVGDGNCGAGFFCFEPQMATGSTGQCLEGVEPDAASCLLSDGCPSGQVCVPDFLVVAVADPDGDEVPEPLDNCPETPNPSQADLDQDGAGDACDLQTCPNLVVELDETCDDGNLVSGDGCDANCKVTACGNGIVTAGEQCDDGNLISGDGCSPGCVVEQCADGIDNDNDGDIDWPQDPGCLDTSASSREGPQCDDNLDNDGDGKVDWDGGPQMTAPDPQCTSPFVSEKPKKRCGAGFELVLVLAPLLWGRARRQGT